jgi:high-affinity K+ transport system ATPase subunit B
MIDLLSFSLCLFAFNGFALAKPAHFKTVSKTRPSQQQSNLLLIVAWISILLSLIFCVATQQGYGALLFCGFMSLSVLIIMIFYNFIDKLIKPFSILNMLLIGLSGLLLVINAL